MNPHPTIGATVVATSKVQVFNAEWGSYRVRGSGNKGVVIGGPAGSGAITLWEVAFNDNFTGWAYQGGLALASPTAPTLTFSPALRTLRPAPSTLTWSSTNATSCSGTGFSPSGASGSRLVSPNKSTTYSITCTGSGGSTTRTTPVIVNPAPDFTWNQSLPVTFDDPAIVPSEERRRAPCCSWTEAYMRRSAIERS